MIDPTNTQTQEMIGGVIRSAIIFAGGTAYLSGNQIATAAGCIAGLIGVAWSIWAKKKKNDTTVSHAVLAKAVTIAAESPPQDASKIIAAAKSGKF